MINLFNREELCKYNKVQKEVNTKIWWTQLRQVYSTLFQSVYCLANEKKIKISKLRSNEIDNYT